MDGPTVNNALAMSIIKKTYSAKALSFDSMTFITSLAFKNWSTTDSILKASFKTSENWARTNQYSDIWEMPSSILGKQQKWRDLQSNRKILISKLMTRSMCCQSWFRNTTAAMWSLNSQTQQNRNQCFGFTSLTYSSVSLKSKELTGKRIKRESHFTSFLN